MTREERHIDYDERIDRYLRGRMDDQERAAFEQEEDGDKELRQRLVATARLAIGIAQEGMRREGQAQLDTIKQMSKEEFIAATRGKGNNRKISSVARWAAAIAAVAILALCLPLFWPASEPPTPNTAEVVNKPKAAKPKMPKKPAKPTLASLAEEYSRPFVSEPDAFAEIRQQIKQDDYHYMMAVVYDIDKVEWPTAKHGPKGADDDEVAKETIDNYADCTHWYKALAYLKAGDKECAVRELTALKKQGKNEELVNRATDLLKKLGH